MGDAVDRFGPVLLDAGVSTAALLGAVAAAMIACRQPARRLFLARAGLIASLAMIALAIRPPLGRVDVLRPASRLLSIAASPYLGDPPPSRPGRPWHCGPAARGATLAYGGGVAAGLAWLLLGWWGVGWLKRGSVEPSTGTQALYRALGHRAPPRLRVSARITRPVLTGAFRPTILIPPDLEAPEAAGRLRLALLHELAHADRRDPWFGLVGGLAQACWFVAPPVWWLRAQMRLDQEFLADRAASTGFDAAGSYAASLLELAAARSRGEDGAKPASRGASSLVPRVLMLVRCPFPVEAHAPPRWRAAAALAVAAGAVAASTIGVGGPQGKPTRGPGPAPRTFYASRLVLAPQPADALGRAKAYEWPLALPARFELTATVWSDVPALGSTRLAGRPLGPPSGPPAADATPGWHRVRIAQDGPEARVWVDESPVTGAVGGLADEYLSVEPPPGVLFQIRDLRVTW